MGRSFLSRRLCPRPVRLLGPQFTSAAERSLSSKTLVSSPPPPIFTRKIYSVVLRPSPLLMGSQVTSTDANQQCHPRRMSYERKFEEDSSTDDGTKKDTAVTEVKYETLFPYQLHSLMNEPLEVDAKLSPKDGGVLRTVVMKIIKFILKVGMGGVDLNVFDLTWFAASKVWRPVKIFISVRDDISVVVERLGHHTVVKEAGSYILPLIHRVKFVFTKNMRAVPLDVSTTSSDKFYVTVSGRITIKLRDSVVLSEAPKNNTVDIIDSVRTAIKRQIWMTSSKTIKDLKKKIIDSLAVDAFKSVGVIVSYDANLITSIPELIPVTKDQVAAADAKDDPFIKPSRVALDCELLDVAIPAPSVPKDASLRGKNSEGKSSGPIITAQSDAGEDEKSAQENLTLDIASSSNGEVIICLMAESILGPNFNVPSLEEVLKEVEVQCIKKHGFAEAEFSIPKMMSDVCERFLAVGTTSTSAEISKSENATLSISKGTSLHPSLCDKPAIPNFHVDVPKFIDRPNSNEKGDGMMEADYLAVSSEKMIVQKQQFGHYVADITKGQEENGISMSNDINEKQLPTFGYISRNMISQKAYVKFQLARQNFCHSCYGDCLSLAIPCACSSETGGEFAYTPQGLLKEKFLDHVIQTKKSGDHCNLFYCQDCPLERSNSDNQRGTCKGHIMRKFIKECWYKCGCSMQCRNRVVQQGIRVKLQVFMTSGPKGWGVRILEDVPKGTFICEYVGEVVTNIELYERNTQTTGERHTYPVLLDADWSCEGILKDEEALCLDATKYGNVARFMNHRCSDGNCVEIPVEVETPDHHYYHLAFFTTRDVNAYEELTWDYGINFADDSHPVKAFRCNCGSKFCRDITDLEMVLEED